jgi:uncharacterized delta-60 repeat protein
MLTAGQLDPTFGTGGKIVTDFIGPLDSALNGASAAMVQPDGKIVVVGAARLGTRYEWAVARLNPDGSLDPSFGTNGRVLEDFQNSADIATAVAIQIDGKIIVAGRNYAGMDLVRYNPDGSLDIGFGVGGKVITTFTNSNSGGADGLAIQPDGKIIVVGSGVGVSQQSQIARYNVNGSLDSSFGAGGEVVAPFGANFSPSAVLLQGDGRIVVAGGNFTAPSNYAWARLNPDGSKDVTFGTGGLVTTTISNPGYPPDVAQQPDGKLLLAAQRTIARFAPDGSLDTSFGTGGTLTTPSQLAQVEGITVLSDGKIAAVGEATFTTSINEGFAAARYNADGTLDTSFGSGGVATTFVGGSDGPSRVTGIAALPGGRILAIGSGSASEANGSGFALVSYGVNGGLDTTFGGSGTVIFYFMGMITASANAVALQPDGKILVIGGVFDLARYLPDGSLDTTFGAGGKVTTAFASPGDTADGVAIQNDGKIVVVGRVAGLFAVVRYNPDGSLDTSFGTGGEVTSDFGSTPRGEASGIVIQPDGKLVAAGTAGSSFAVARYNPDGSLDTSFGTSGKVTTTTPTQGLPQLSLYGAVLQSDGKILVWGVDPGTYFSPGAETVLVRYNADGSLDSTFGSGGLSFLGYPFGSKGGLALQSDGKILIIAAGGLLRLNSDGTTDTSFGANGSVMTGLGRTGGITVEADGKILLVGGLSDPPQPGGFAVKRYNANGTVDATFGAGGLTSTDFGGNPVFGTAILIQPNGKIVAVGTAQVGNGSDFAIARYLPDNVGTPNQRFVEQLYWDLLQRPVDASGLASWSGMLDRGVSHAQVITAIQSSLESRTLVVGNLYQRVLGRPVDPSGLSTWVSFLNQGGTAEQVESFLLGSDEFFAAHGSDITQGFLPALYQVVLQRPIDASGAQSWSQTLQSGNLSRQAVAAAVLASLESDRLEIQNLYMQFLHRAADPLGLSNFSNALQQGVPNEQVALLLMNSAEYSARA